MSREDAMIKKLSVGISVDSLVEAGAEAFVRRFALYFAAFMAALLFLVALPLAAKRPPAPPASSHAPTAADYEAAAAVILFNAGQPSSTRFFQAPCKQARFIEDLRQALVQVARLDAKERFAKLVATLDSLARGERWGDWKVSSAEEVAAYYEGVSPKLLEEARGAKAAPLDAPKPEPVQPQTPVEWSLYARFGEDGIRVWRLIDGKRNLEEIMLCTGTDEKTVRAVADWLKEEGHVKLDTTEGGESGAAQAPPASPEAKAPPGVKPPAVPPETRTQPVPPPPAGDLLQAVKLGDLSKVRSLLDQGANPNAADENGATALMWAAKIGNLDIVKALIAKGADPKKKGAIYTDEKKESYYGSFLCAAAGEGHEEIVRYGLEVLKIPVDDQEINPKDGTENGWTALMWAACNGHKDVCELLISKGADVNAKEDKLGATPLMYSAVNGHKDVCELLISKGADVNARDKDGWTPLMAAAKNGHKDVCELLISKGADINARDKDGKTALKYAIENKKNDVADFLRSKGAKE